MSRRDFIAGAAALPALAGPNASHARPNLLVIVADDMGYSDPCCYGGEVDTPNLDNLAQNGLRFSQCYSTARCWPSRACLLTGYYAQQVRMDPPVAPLPRWARVLPHYLKPAGYRCYHSGKWHLMGAPRPVADGGFDRSYVLLDHDRHFDPQRHRLDDRDLPPIGADDRYYTTTAIANMAIKFLEGHAASSHDTPFCLYLAFTAPHFPIQAPQPDIDRHRERYACGWDEIRTERWRRMRSMGLVNCELPRLDTSIIPSWNRSPEELAAMIGPGEAPWAVPWSELDRDQQVFQALKMAIHAGMVHRMDAEIGRVMSQVRAMGAWDNTLTLFVSDNGASAEQMIRGPMHDKTASPGGRGSYLCLGPGWSTASNTPFRLHKSWVHEGGIASPLIAHWPLGIRAKGALRRTPCHFVDILPTLCDVAGAKPEREWNRLLPPEMPGRSLAPTFRRDAHVPHESFFWRHEGHRAVRVGDWKLVSIKDGPWELYDVRTDRSEQHDRSRERPDLVERLARRWQELEAAYESDAATG